MKALPCSHVICDICFEIWTNERGYLGFNCPVCRREATGSGIGNIRFTINGELEPTLKKRKPTLKKWNTTLKRKN